MPPVTRTTEPPGAGRGARQRILKAAAELFYCEGINATGVELIANKASVSKRTLYQHFPSKSALVEEYLRGLRQAAGEADKMPKASNATPRERLLALFDRPNRGDGRMRGCPFHNAAVEAAGEMPGVERIVHSHKRDYIKGLARLARSRRSASAQPGQSTRRAVRGRGRTVHLPRRCRPLGARPSGSGGPD